MALRRQGLSQRRKAVGLTQESLAEHLGVERSTVVRWEAGDTEPLPSIRPKVARALHVSIDQLAELLAGPETAGTTQALPADNEVTIPMLLPEVRSEVLPDRAEFGDPTRPQAADTADALRSAAVVPQDSGAILLVGRSSRVPLASAEPGRPVAADADLKAAIALCAVLATLSRLPADIAHPADVDTASVNLRPDTLVTTTVGAGGLARSRRFKRFAAAGVVALAFAAGAASVPFITSHSGLVSPAAAGSPVPAAPVAANPAPNPGSKDSTGAVDTAPVAAPNNSADGPAPPAIAAVPAPHTTRSDNRTTSRPKRRASTTTPSAPRAPAIPAEVAAWSQMAKLSTNDQRMTYLRSGALSRP